MTSQVAPPSPSDTGLGFTPAAIQSPAPADVLLHSANAGLLVHRVGQLRYEFREEGLAFASDLVQYINATQSDYTTVFLYEELLGTQNRLHWLLHLRQPNDYHRLLEMVDHSEKWREISERDRLPEKGGGGWERMFVEGSLRETIICPQHGLGHGDEHEHDTFQPAARYQTTLTPERLLNSATAPLIVHRTGQARYAVRDEARVFVYEWAGYVNQALEGELTAFLYEEMWGRQDRLHTLIHLASIDACRRLLDLHEHDAGLRELFARQWAPGARGHGWEYLFVDGSLVETLLVPRNRPTPSDPVDGGM